MFNTKYYQLGTAPSVIRKLFAYGLEQAKIVGEENVYDYSLGNPSIPSPAKVNQSIHKIVDDVEPLKLHGYSMAPGFDDARAAVAESLSRRFDMDLNAGNLFFTCGAAPAFVAVCKALAALDNSEIIAIAPFFPEYRVFVEESGAIFKVAPADKENFQIDIDGVSAILSSRTQAVIINSPNNPSGAVYTEETLRELAGLLRAKSKEYGHQIYIISDEPYRELVYGDARVPFVPHIYENSIICYSFSKSLSIPGERIGYVCIPDRCADAQALYAAVAGASRAIGHVCSPTLMQRVIQECADEMPDLEAYDQNRRLIYSALTKMGYECVRPDGAFYMFVKAPNGDANRFSEKAMKDFNLLVVPGEGFGCPDYFRLSYCVDHEMIKRSLPAFQAMIDAYK